MRRPAAGFQASGRSAGYGGSQALCDCAWRRAEVVVQGPVDLATSPPSALGLEQSVRDADSGRCSGQPHRGRRQPVRAGGRDARRRASVTRRGTLTHPRPLGEAPRRAFGFWLVAHVIPNVVRNWIRLLEAHVRMSLDCFSAHRSAVRRLFGLVFLLVTPCGTVCRTVVIHRLWSRCLCGQLWLGVRNTVANLCFLDSIGSHQGDDLRPGLVLGDRCQRRLISSRSLASRRIRDRSGDASPAHAGLSRQPTPQATPQKSTIARRAFGGSAGKASKLTRETRKIRVTESPCSDNAVELRANNKEISRASHDPNPSKPGSGSSSPPRALDGDPAELADGADSVVGTSKFSMSLRWKKRYRYRAARQRILRITCPPRQLST